MRRAPYVIAGTFAGVAGILAYPTHPLHLKLPAQAAGSASPATTAPPASTSATTLPGSAATTAPGSAATTPATAPPSSAARQAAGADQPYPYGDIAVQVKVAGTRITDVVVTRQQVIDGTSSYINQQAFPLLRQQVLAAQSANINGVSGATYTAQAYVNSVQSALDKLGVK